jgi:hypothetical protein
MPLEPDSRLFFTAVIAAAADEVAIAVNAAIAFVVFAASVVVVGVGKLRPVFIK